MISNIYLEIFSLFLIILLTGVYFSKKRIVTVEHKIFKLFIIISIIGLIFDILNVFTILNFDGNLMLNIVAKLNISFTLLWIFILTLYIFVLSFKKKEKISEDYGVLLKKLIIGFIFAFIICLVVLFVLPVEIINEENIVYLGGLSVNFLYIISIACIFISIFRFITRTKLIKKIKSNLIVSFITIGLISLIIQIMYPEFLFIYLIKLFIIFFMYFTLENPDLELINELNIAKEQVEKVNAAKSDSILKISHAIRTPLNAIMGFSQSLLEEDVSEDIKEDIKYMMMGTQSLFETVNNILDISNVEAQRLKIVGSDYNVSTTLKQIVSLAKSKINRKVDFKVDIDKDLPNTLNGDNIRLKQIILNLLTNSIKYTKEGYIELKVSGIVSGNICRLIISVSDTGIGIKEDKIDKLFNKRIIDEKELTIEGTGTDLTITKKIVELMNGEISVESEYGEGSKFTIAIDQRLVDDTITKKVDTPTEIKKIDAKGKKILIVDDDRMNLKVASKLLKNYNVEIDEVTSGIECLDKINNGMKYDLIFLDDWMPGMSGIETLKKLDEIKSFNTPVVVLTANAVTGMKQKYLNEGFDDYIPKPIERKELSRVINKFLQ